jgi:hypothetical protein
MQATCYYCGRVLIHFVTNQKGRVAPDNGWTRDHIVPRHIRGRHAHVTQVDCCHACNQDKGRLTLEEFRAVVMYRRGMIADAKLNSYRFPGEKQCGGNNGSGAA